MSESSQESFRTLVAAKRFSRLAAARMRSKTIMIRRSGRNVFHSRRDGLFCMKGYRMERRPVLDLEVQAAIKQLKRKWKLASAADRQTAIFELIDRGCSKRALAASLDIPEATLRYYSNRPRMEESRLEAQPGAGISASPKSRKLPEAGLPSKISPDSKASIPKHPLAGPKLRQESGPASKLKISTSSLREGSVRIANRPEPAAATKSADTPSISPPPVDPRLDAIAQLEDQVVTIIADVVRSRTDTLGGWMRTTRLQQIFSEARNWKGRLPVPWRDQPPAQINMDELKRCTRPTEVHYDSPGPSPVFVAE